jgi:hypothetical protein
MPGLRAEFDSIAFFFLNRQNSCRGYYAGGNVIGL